MDLDMVLVDVMNRDPRVQYPHDDVDELSSESDAEQQEEEVSQPEQPQVESGQSFDHELPTRHTVRILNIKNLNTTQYFRICHSPF